MVAIRRGQAFEAVTDITRSSVISWTEIKDAQPSILLTEEWLYAKKIVGTSRDWQAALRKRNIGARNVVCVVSQRHDIRRIFVALPAKHLSALLRAAPHLSRKILSGQTARNLVPEPALAAGRADGT